MNNKNFDFYIFDMSVGNRKLSGTDRRRRDRRFSCTQNVRTDRAVRSRTCP